MSIKNRLQAYRKLHGKTQEEMAKLLGVTKNSYYNKETGNCDFTITEAKKLADFYGITVDNLFFENILFNKNNN